MDLDFVDPPLEPGMIPYELSIAPEDAGEQLRMVGQALEKSRGELSELGAATVAKALADPEAAQVFRAHVPFIARFLTIELDTENPIGKGIARVHPREPPPRFGDKFGKSLRRVGVKGKVFPVVDQLVFRGFATAVAANGMRDEPFEMDFDTPIEDRWNAFMRHVPLTYAAFAKPPEDSAESRFRAIVCGPVDEAFDEFVGVLAGPVRPYKRSRARTYTWYFSAVGWSAYYACSPEAS